MIDPILLQNVRDQNSLVELLKTSENRGGLGWPVDTDLPFELKPEIAAGIKGNALVNVSRLIPATTDEKHLVLLAEFEQPYVRRDLRELLRSVRHHIRATGQFKDHNGLGDTLFIVVAAEYEEVRFVLFEEREGRLPRIRSFGWSRENIGRTVLEYNLQRLRWSDNTNWEAAWDVERVTGEFFREYQQAFTSVEDLIMSENPRLTAQVLRLFTQRLFNRLLFIQFLSKRRWLRFEGSTDYLNALLHRSLENSENFYSDRLYWTFFSGLGTDSREIHELPALVERRGELPYLNGGLFEMDNELDVRGAVQIPNGAFTRIITELFGRWNFTVMESSSLDVEVAVDPEMLGKVFEELVTGRHATGSYYTPRSIVSFMCREALKAYLGGFAELVDDL